MYPNTTNLTNHLPPEALVYMYGSQVYGTATYESDLDLQIILPDSIEKKEDWINKLAGRGLDLHVWNHTAWQQALDDHRVYALECWYAPRQNIYQNQRNIPFKFKLDKSKLRSEFSRVASNSWVKAKKKLIVEADYNEKISKKSIFHSFRILDFGIQIAMMGRIDDYSTMNELLAEIYRLPSDWDIIDETFRERHNQLASRFREVCPK